MADRVSYWGGRTSTPEENREHLRQMAPVLGGLAAVPFTGGMSLLPALGVEALAAAGAEYTANRLLQKEAEEEQLRQQAAENVAIDMGLGLLPFGLGQARHIPGVERAAKSAWGAMEPVMEPIKEFALNRLPNLRNTVTTEMSLDPDKYMASEHVPMMMYHGGQSGDVGGQLDPFWEAPNLLRSAGVFTTESPVVPVGYAIGSGWDANYHWASDDLKRAFADQLQQADIQDIVERTEGIVQSIPETYRQNRFGEGPIPLRDVFDEKAQNLTERIYQFQQTGDLDALPSPDELANWGIELEPLSKSVDLNLGDDTASRYKGYVKMKKPFDVDAPVSNDEIDNILSAFERMEKDAHIKSGSTEPWIDGEATRHWRQELERIHSYQNPNEPITGWDVVNLLTGQSQERMYADELLGPIENSLTLKNRASKFQKYVDDNGVKKTIDKRMNEDWPDKREMLDDLGGEDLLYMEDYESEEEIFEMLQEHYAGLVDELYEVVSFKRYWPDKKWKSYTDEDFDMILWDMDDERTLSVKAMESIRESVKDLLQANDGQYWRRNIPDEAQNTHESIVRSIFEEAGYDGMVHVGGVTDLGAPHRVAVAFRGGQFGAAPEKSDNLTGLKVFMGLGAGGAVAATGRQEQ